MRNDASKNPSETEYRELVRLAYYILPGRGKRIYRLAMARRIVDRTSGLGRGHARRRTRVLRRAMNPSRRWQIGLGPWLRSMPARLPDPPLTAMLSTLEPRVRVAYVLLHVAEMPRYAVRDQLVALRVPDPLLVIEAAEEKARDMARRAARRKGGQATVGRPAPPPSAGARRTGTDPFARVRPRSLRGRTPLPIGVAVALTMVLLGALVISETGDGGRLLGGTSSADAHNLRLVTPAPDAWERAPRGLDVWPARGDLTGDRAFTERALKAWAAAAKAGRTGPAGDPQLLFAGRVEGRPVALLRRGDKVGRFTGTDGRLAVSTVDTDPSAPMAVDEGRYLLAPWERAETLTGAKVPVQHGVTGPASPRTRCGRGPVLQLRSDGGARTMGEFGGQRLVALAHRSPTHTATPTSTASPTSTGSSTSTGQPEKPAKPQARKPVKQTGPNRPAPPKGQLLTGEALRVWERVACLTSPSTRPVTEATAWEFWSGTLPRGAGRGQWVCTVMSFAGGGAAGESALLDKRGAQGTGGCDHRRPVAGAWRRGADGDWRYLAAAARGLTPRVKGPFRTSKVRSRLLTAAPVQPKRRPTAPVVLDARPS